MSIHHPPLKVLIVDDCRDAADTLADLLKAYGYSALAVYGGQEALLVCEEFAPDVLLIDLLMPNVNGFQLAMSLNDQIWQRRPFLVAVSGLLWEGEFLKEFDSGFDACLIKPFESRQLLELLKQFELRIRTRRSDACLV